MNAIAFITAMIITYLSNKNAITHDECYHYWQVRTANKPFKDRASEISKEKLLTTAIWISTDWFQSYPIIRDQVAVGYDGIFIERLQLKRNLCKTSKAEL